MCFSAASILMALLLPPFVPSMSSSVVAVVGIVTFYGFATLLYFRLALSFLLAWLSCKAQIKLRHEEDARRNGTDQRNIMQVCNTECVQMCHMYTRTHFA